MQKTVNAGARLDRLPTSAFHRRILWLIGGGMFLDSFDIYLAGGVLGALTRSGWSNIQLNANFLTATFVGMLIGADGLWSNIRKQVVGDGPPRVSGHTTYRSVIPTEQMPEDLRWNAATLWAGPKCHIVHYPLSGWKLFNLVVTYHNDAPEPVARNVNAGGFTTTLPGGATSIVSGADWP